MELHISDKITIKELQLQFSRAFPYLKLEFFDMSPSGKSLAKPRIHASHKTLGACRKMHNEGTIRITGQDTVEKLETTFREKFGLSAEVFRKSGNLWIETTLSEAWTLESQNEEGKVFSPSKSDKKGTGLTNEDE